MICVILPTFNDEARLTAALAPLVPASMEGLVRQLIIADRGSTDATLEIADDAGALILNTTHLSVAIAAARGPWLMLLDPSVRLEFGWESSAKRHIESRKDPARFRIEQAQGGVISRLFPPPVAAHLILKTDTARVSLVQHNGRLEARGRAQVLEARGRI